MMTSAEPRVSASREGDVSVLRVNVKELVDYDTADEIGKELTRAVGDSVKPKVVVDMGGLEFLSSVGYTPFIRLRAYVREADGRLLLANMPEMIFEVFEATRLLINPSSPKSLFEYRQSVDEAVAEMS